MKSHKISLKLYAKPDTLPAAAQFVAVFHDWIKEGALGETLIDVVDYGHVHHGPAVLLIGHESDLALDLSEGRPGLSYQRKRVAKDDPATRLGDSLRRLLRAAARLESDPRLAGLGFEVDELLLRVLDRLHAPNELATYESERRGIEDALRGVFGASAALSREGLDPRAPFTVRARTGARGGARAVLERALAS